ncbi:hypothetical protein GN330_10630 [Nitratireductor sp. CAU 1489]|uniref:Uncharacterized protein n=1 Tax=Nitratireductor arenosus TaxID=2682096 RepID=A0A844QJ20_9HYPH|nr:hypothetical protein [Nitratireductor arenosus]MVA97699.1 hypothetical protein [Nitratireductor arenosus]
MRNTREYFGSIIPPSSTLPMKEDIENCKKILGYLYHEEVVDIGKGRKYTLMKPESTSQTRIIRGSVSSIYESPQESDVEKFAELSDLLHKRECYFWNSFGLSDLDVIFVDKFSLKNIVWMSNARVRETQGITCVDGSFSIVSFMFFDFSIVVASSELTYDFDKIWDYKNRGRAEFERYIGTYADGEQSRKWLAARILPLIK